MNHVGMFFSVLLFSCSCNAENTVKNIVIDNEVAECIEFYKNKIVNHTNLLLLNTSWEIKSSTGLCGCKSAALKYTVKREYTTKGDDNRHGHEEVFSTGIFNTLKFFEVNRESFDFVLSSIDKNLTLNC